MIIYSATHDEWDRIKDKKSFVSDDYDKEGFIHCCYPKQCTWVLNKHYKKDKSVLLLAIDPELLTGRLVVEDTSGRGEGFPHVYGEINRDSVVKVIEIRQHDDGKYYDNDEVINL